MRGRGESAGDVARPSRHDPLGDDVVAAIRHLREAHGQNQFLLAGYCYDALTALDSFKEEAGAIAAYLLDRGKGTLERASSEPTSVTCG